MWPSTYVSPDPSLPPLTFLIWMACRITTLMFQSTCHRSCSSARLIPSTPSHHHFSWSFIFPSTRTTRSYKIVRRFLLPKQVAQNGLSEAHVKLTEPALLQTVTHYTQEARVRSLERGSGELYATRRSSGPRTSTTWACRLHHHLLPRQQKL